MCTVSPVLMLCQWFRVCLVCPLRKGRRAPEAKSGGCSSMGRPVSCSVAARWRPCPKGRSVCMVPCGVLVVALAACANCGDAQVLCTNSWVSVACGRCRSTVSVGKDSRFDTPRQSSRIGGVACGCTSVSEGSRCRVSPREESLGTGWRGVARCLVPGRERSRLCCLLSCSRRCPWRARGRDSNSV
jgi:hypothetical protein